MRKGPYNYQQDTSGWGVSVWGAFVCVKWALLTGAPCSVHKHLDSWKYLISFEKVPRASSAPIIRKSKQLFFGRFMLVLNVLVGMNMKN